ncbi:MAG: alpha-L-fucosidase [Sedimentisphaerales bacterium]|nr:alpha-L-fucosidase [Sedimentisphaerales bacterium]
MLMRTTIIYIVTACIVCSASAAEKQYQPNWESLDSRPTPQWFLDAKFGIFIHWGVYSVPAWGPEKAYSEWYWNNTFNADGSVKDNEWGRFHRANYGDDFQYQDFARMFRCEMFDPNEWADIFAKSGARYVVSTSKHHDGFCLWPSKDANKTWGRFWNSADTGPKRDLLGDLTESVRRTGLKMGIYYSLYEWYNPLWRIDRKRYVAEHMIPQFKDVVTRYRPSLIFSDGEWDMPDTNWQSPQLLAWLFNESPSKQDVVINDRWGKDIRHKHGGYYTTEYGAGLKDASHPWEENRGIGNSFGYNRNEPLSNYKTSQELVLMLIDLVSRGGNLLLDVGPTADGRIPMIMQSRLIEIGQWLQVNGEAIYGTRPWKTNAQWSDGARPDQEYKQHMSDYRLMDSIGKPKGVKAVIQAFFTAKADTLYAITPGWPGSELVLADVNPAPGGTVTILGIDSPITWKPENNGIRIDLSRITADMLPCQWAYAFRIPIAAETQKPADEKNEPENDKPRERDAEDELERILIDRLGELLKQ